MIARIKGKNIQLWHIVGWPMHIFPNLNGPYAGAGPCCMMTLDQNPEDVITCEL
jgi:hypothetical protein